MGNELQVTTATLHAGFTQEDADKVFLRSLGSPYAELMTVKNFRVVPIERRAIKDFMEMWHYSKNINGVTSNFCFALYRGEELIGAAIFGLPATGGVKEAYNQDGTRRLIELRRLVCVDDTPRNTESYFIGQMLRWLEKNTQLDLVLAYSDETYGHVGTIYKASNFKHVGLSPPIRKIKWQGKLYHDKSMRTTNNGILKPFACRLAAAVKSGEAEWVDTKQKHIYLYDLRNRI